MKKAVSWEERCMKQKLPNSVIIYRVAEKCTQMSNEIKNLLLSLRLCLISRQLWFLVVIIINNK